MGVQGQAPLTDVPRWDIGWPFANSVTTTSLAAPCFAQLSVLTSGHRDDDDTEVRRQGGQAVAQRIGLHVRKMEVMINRLWRLHKSFAVMGHSGGAGPAHRSPGIMCYHVMIPVPPHEAAA